MKTKILQIIIICCLNLLLSSCARHEAQTWYKIYGIETRQDILKQESIPAIVQAINDDNIYTQYRAIKALGNIGPDAKNTVPHLLLKLNNPNHTVRRLTVLALGKIADDQPEVRKKLEIVLKIDPNRDVRNAAKKVLTDYYIMQQLKN